MSRELLKRVVPFAVALTLGLFVASFFVTVAAPRFNFNRGYGSRRSREIRDLRNENHRLREQLNRQQIRIVELQNSREAEMNDRFTRIEGEWHEVNEAMEKNASSRKR